jgi:hypothetical protein
MKDDAFFADLEKLIKQEQEQEQELLPEDITIARLSKSADWNRYRTVKVLDDWVKAGKVESLGLRREPTRGQMVKAWRIKTIVMSK